MKKRARKRQVQRNPLNPPTKLENQIAANIEKIERTALNFDAVFEAIDDKECIIIKEHYGTFLQYFTNDLKKIIKPGHKAAIFYNKKNWMYATAQIFNILYQITLVLPEETSEEATEYLERVNKRLIELTELIIQQYKFFFEEIKKCLKMGKV